MDDDRTTLAELDKRLRRDVDDMLAVLAEDVPAFVRRTARRVFGESPRADAMSDAEVKRLKLDAEATAAKTCSELSAAVGRFEAWRWPGPEAPPAAGQDLDAHPALGPALLLVQEHLLGLLGRHGIEAAPETCRYRLPTYFVAGRFMKSLVEGYWRTLALHHEVQERLRQHERLSERERREARWDGV